MGSADRHWHFARSSREGADSFLTLRLRLVSGPLFSLPAVGGALASPRPAPCQSGVSTRSPDASVLTNVRQAGASTAPAKPVGRFDADSISETQAEDSQPPTGGEDRKRRCGRARSSRHPSGDLRPFRKRVASFRMVNRVALFPLPSSSDHASDWSVARRLKGDQASSPHESVPADLLKDDGRESLAGGERTPAVTKLPASGVV